MSPAGLVRSNPRKKRNKGAGPTAPSSETVSTFLEAPGNMYNKASGVRGGPTFSEV